MAVSTVSRRSFLTIALGAILASADATSARKRRNRRVRQCPELGPAGFDVTIADGQRYQLPIIGTPAYSASCYIAAAWEDGSAHAYCQEDGAGYTFDPDGQPVAGIPSNPVRCPGWYPMPNLG